MPSFFDWDPYTNERIDRKQRPELCYGVIDLVAPQEYMVRPPQPVVLLFVIDVSYAAVQSGMLDIAVHSILSSLDRISDDDGRTRIGFITVDRVYHFYNLSVYFML